MRDKLIRVLIADDHEMVREGLKLMLDDVGDVQIVGEAGDGTEVIRLVDELEPEVVLLDLKMPGMHGLEVLSLLRGRSPDKPRVVILTVHDDEDLVRQAVVAGADAYVLKHASRDELMYAIRRVSAGKSHYDSAVVMALAKVNDGDSPPALTQRELEVLGLAADGRSNKEIAAVLFVSVETVKSHLDNIYRKLGAQDRAHACAIAVRRGLLR
jgi:DNA-binding NarL/FixJ family response regulator